MELREIVLSQKIGEVKVAVKEDGELVEYYVEREDLKNTVGNIYRGKITAVKKTLQAIFVNIGHNIDGFLPISDYNYTHPRMPPKVGDPLIVQITKEPYGTKGARLTTVITIPGRYLVLMPMVKTVGVSKKISDRIERKRLISIAKKAVPRGTGAILRTSAKNVDIKKVRSEANKLLKEWKNIKKIYDEGKGTMLLRSEQELVIKVTRDLFDQNYSKVIVDSKGAYNKIVRYMKEKNIKYRGRVNLYQGEKSIFEHYKINSELSNIYRRKVWLKNGGYIVNDHPEAMHVIDVNSGKYAGKKKQEDMVYETNLLAAKEIARQLRLRDLGGIIIVDFIDMVNEEHKENLLNTLKSYFSTDRTKVDVIDITSLGLVEITRERIRRTLSMAFTEPCPVCQGKGVVFSKPYLLSLAEDYIERERGQLRGKEVYIFVNPGLMDYFEEKAKEKIESIAREYKIHINIQPDYTLPFEKIKILRRIKDSVIEEEI